MVKITHILDKTKKESLESDKVSIFLSSRKGDYLWLGKGIPESRYEGWFCRIDREVFRILEFIDVKEGGEVLEIENGFTYYHRKREKVSEIIYLVPMLHAMVYELDKEKEIELFLDVRHSYSQEGGADYTIEKRGEVTLVVFANGIVLAIRGGDSQELGGFVNRHYDYDKKRNSPPFYRDVRKGVRLSGKRFVFAVAKSKREAFENASRMFVRSILDSKEKEVDMQCARTALSNLFVPGEEGIYAGLPWFFQFWPRDEAISLKSFLSIDERRGKEVFFRLIRDAMKKGPGGALNIDATGWVFKRAEDLIPLATSKEREMIRRGLKKHIEELLWAFTKEGFATNRPKETWMDSLNREGARIEIQAMRLNMYRLAASLAKKRSEKVFYKRMEKDLKKKVRDAFFDGENLYDGYYPYRKVTEKVIRPNIFIAAYIYPDLLSKKEWIKCFDNALSCLWLPWGGLSTLDKKNENFRTVHTGENPDSYHQGDSWFYLNNLAALVLYRTDKRRYADYIGQIMEASKKEILSMGAIGVHAEVSSAEELRSEGCVNQAWSSAMYLEAKREIGEI